ncbi:FAD-dependent oxidoreductase [Kitasatospora nipponensis]|uniref:FAD-dependent oxidoreductase n=1 Tax=Kitasatospora nipponensis TaxID=258049 RepID=A0ABN1W3H6_9ACTN
MTDVLIVGAGPTGLTLACDLARRGVAVRVVERAAAHHRESRGKGLLPRSLEVLADLAVADRITAAGGPEPVLRKYFDGAPVADTDPAAGRATEPGAVFAQGLLIGQWQVEEVLRERLAELGGAVELGAELVGLVEGPHGVGAELADGRRIEARYLVGCDGGRSTVRGLLALPFEGYGAAVESMVCGDVTAPGLSRDFWHQWYTADGGVLLCPLPGGDLFQFQASPELDHEGRPLPPSLAGFQRLLDRHARVPGLVLGDGGWISSWRVNVRMVDRLRVGRVLLAGDAAHVHPIAGGLGMNTGIQDAFNLGWKLALVIGGQAGPALLDSYQEERLPVAAATLAVTSERLERALAAVRRPGQGTEAGLGPATGRDYRGSSLAVGEGNAALRPGDRAPDAPCVEARGGWPTRLFGHFTGPRFTLLGFGPGAGSALREVGAARGELVRTVAVGAAGAVGVRAVGGVDRELLDPDGSVRRGYGLGADALVLVRPDHHVALIAPAAGGAGPVLDYLAGLGR